VEGWLLMGSAWPTVFLTAFYLMIVWSGPKLMENRKPWNLRWLMVTYNLSMVVLCSYIWIQIVVGALRRNYSWICQPVSHDSHPEEVRIAAALWWFYFSKAIEFMDTFIFILRKKVDAMIRQIVIRGPSRGHSDMLFGRPTPGRPLGRPGVSHPQGLFGVFNYYYLVMLFLNMVCLTVALAKRRHKSRFFTSTITPPCSSSGGSGSSGWREVRPFLDPSSTRSSTL
jgi:hypothetical protein